MSHLSNWVSSWPFRIAAMLIQVFLGVLPIAVAQSLGRWLGRLGWLLLKKERRQACRNLGYFSEGLADRTRQRIARSSFIHMGETVIEAVSLSMKSRDHLGSNPVAGGIRVRGIDQFRTAIERCHDLGKGVILISGHIGSWELVGALIGTLLPHENAFVARRYRNPAQQDWIGGIRSRLGTRLVYQDESLLKSIRLLQRGGVLTMLPDLDIHRMDGIHVPFFGELAHTSTGPARLAIHSGSPILPFFLIRDRDGYHFEIEDPIISSEMAAEGSELTEILTGEINRSLERAIRRHPSQWPWMHDRWHSTPEIVERRRLRRAGRLVEGEPQGA